jgi:hypothetical protein
MPSALTVDQLNQLLSREGVGNIDTEHLSFQNLRNPDALIDVTRDNELVHPDGIEYLELLPQTLLEGIRATIVRAVELGKAVQFQYSPAYEFGVKIWDYGEGIGIHLEGPDPDGFTRPDFKNEARPGGALA